MVGGVVALDDTPFTAIYLSLFGGEVDDSGNPDAVSKQWWGNRDDQDLSAHVRSRTQAMLFGLPATSANMPRVKAAAQLDLAWLTDQLARAVEVVVSAPARGIVKIEVFGTGKDGTPFMFDFSRPWGAQ